MSGDFRTRSGKDPMRQLAEWAERTEKRATEKLVEPANALADETRSQLGRPGHGRVYHYGRGRLGARLHQASAPGEPPAPNTRTLQKSIHIEHPRPGVVRVIADAPGAAALEFGSGRMGPRPFLRPALSAIRKAMTEKFVAALKRGRR